MSLNTQPEMPLNPRNEQAVEAPTEPRDTAPAAPTNPAVADFRKGFFTEPRYGLLLALGEDPEDYQKRMESLLEDLQPRPGLETRLVEQIGETLWRMERVQRMRDGLALKSIRAKVKGEDMAATIRASQVMEAMEPYERLEKALARRGASPWAAEIDAFVASRQGDCSPAMQEFILLLKSLKEPMETRERKAARHKARAQLRSLMEGFKTLAWQSTRQLEHVRSPENLAALMAPQDEAAAHLQRMEDSPHRRLWRLTSTFAKVRQGALEKKMLGKHERSRNIAESKGTSDKLPEQRATFRPYLCVFCRSLQFFGDNLFDSVG